MEIVVSKADRLWIWTEVFIKGFSPDTGIHMCGWNFHLLHLNDHPVKNNIFSNVTYQGYDWWFFIQRIMRPISNICLNVYHSRANAIDLCGIIFSTLIAKTTYVCFLLNILHQSSFFFSPLSHSMCTIIAFFLEETSVLNLCTY